MSFTERFKEPKAIETMIEIALPAIVADVTVAAGPLQADYKRSQQYQQAAVIFASVGILAIFFPASDAFRESFPAGILIPAVVSVVIGIILCSTAYFCNKQSRKFSNNFLKIVHNLVYTAALKILTLADAQRILFTFSGPKTTTKVDQATVGFVSKFFNAPEYQQVISLLDYSELITEQRNHIQVGDMVTFTVNTKSIFVAEIDAKHVTGSGKHQRTTKVFHGYFVSCELPIKRTGKTFVSTDGDRDGFGHRTFWNTRVTANSGLSEVTLEWNDFENLLHVAAASQIEAREILTPDFMHSLYLWWNTNHGNIRLSFIDSRLYILFPSATVKLNASVRTITSEAVRTELLAITKPLIPVLQLIETL